MMLPVVATPVPPMCYAVIAVCLAHGGWVASRGNKVVSAGSRSKNGSVDRKHSTVINDIVSDEHMYLSRCGSPAFLFVYRWLCLLYISYVCLEQITRIRSLRIYKFYTVWNWYLLLSYFALAAGWSLQWMNRLPLNQHSLQRNQWKNSRRHWTVVLLHVNLTTVFIVNTFTWLVLVPMMLSNPDTADKAKQMFFTFTSYNQHGVNSLLILGDLMLNAIPFQGYTVGYAGLWSGLYSVWAHTYHALHGEW
eukprot:CAMPEP_0117664302 /NCGR_PEP_ID=MMETSP0804-20121206/9140_1 /TAXON_ID=1074897 /ORGANISM="Tetraselmis astigmatica, Strain CCMP880" /LENGTH=248 /DNA_ID=CAMNT_0005471511 /DNA_START=336 /DNA_END=1079 /DNA_ORIENTATION=+